MFRKDKSILTTLWALCGMMGLTVSCSSDNIFEDVTKLPQEQRGELVKLSASCPPVTSQTRGTGSVGDVSSSADNVWKGNELHIYSIFKNANDLSIPYQDEDMFVPTILLGVKSDNYMGQLGYAPYDMNSGNIELFTGTGTRAKAYYPIVGAYHFMGFHIDDAKAEAKLNDDASSIIVNVEYDGSQDIMIASDTGNYTTRTARAGEHPNLKFRHQLTRLSFYVQAGDAHATCRDYVAPNEEIKQLIESLIASDPSFVAKQGVFIDGIKVKNQYNTGFMRVDCDSVTWHFTKNQKTDFDLKMEEKVGAEKENQAYKVADMMVTPDFVYYADIDLAEYIDSSGSIFTDKHYTRTYKNIKITPPNGSTDFLPGYSYDVKITVYALEKIEITSSLSGWSNGGSIEVCPDDDEQPENPGSGDDSEGDDNTGDDNTGNGGNTEGDGSADGGNTEGGNTENSGNTEGDGSADRGNTEGSNTENSGNTEGDGSAESGNTETK